jgi:hypothetical protein
MKLSHDTHYENIILYGECSCGASKFDSMTFSELIEQNKKRKLLETYPDLTLGKKLDELSASIPF